MLARFSRFLLLSLAPVLSFAVLSDSSPRPALADAFAPTKFEDSADGSCDNDCSLREAVIAANANPGPDLIQLSPGTYTLSLAGAGEDAALTGDLDVNDDLTIVGVGASSTIIDGGAKEVTMAGTGPGLDGVFQVFSPGPVPPKVALRLSELTIQNAAGPAIDVSDASLTFTNGILMKNKGPGVWAYRSSSTILRDLEITQNISPGGAAVWAAESVVDISRASIHGNTNIPFPGEPGTVHVTLSSLMLTDTTIGPNTGYGLTADRSEAWLTNLTSSTNTGDGIRSLLSQITASFATVASNGGAGIRNTITVCDPVASCAVDVSNTIVANNTGGSCVTENGATIVSGGHNLAVSCGFSAPGDISATDPMLGPLANNGGFTQTHALLAGSPAIDNGSSSCPPPKKDQRGFTRPMGPACDIGAFELKSPLADTDGDTIPNFDDPDDDNDGCTDVQEAGSIPALGGLRDPHNFWDFFDTPFPNRDRRVAVNDILAIVERFGSVGDPKVDPFSNPPPAPAYHTAFDRSFVPGAYPWDSGPPDGRVTVLDITLVVAQFGHTCAFTTPG